MPFDTSQDAYIRLRNIVVERTSPIVVWVGAGCSATSGLPTWPQLKAQLLDAFKRKIDSLDAADRPLLETKRLRIKNEANFWLAFQLLNDNLGHATYRAVVREALRPADTIDPPPIYRSLWRLRVRGLINLNIDRLATKAYVSETGIGTPVEFSGAQGSRLAYLLKEPRPFILNIHGIADDSTTWIFTKRELNELLKSDAYKNFIRACLSSHTILFLGLTADDRSVGGHLESLAQLGIDTGIHYWVTSRTDSATDRWAEAIGIRVIRYQAFRNDHSALDEMLADLLTYIPPEDPPLSKPVVASAASIPAEPVPSPLALAKYDAEEIRKILNAHVREILGKSDTNTLEEYQKFCDSYDEAVYHAWYTSTTPPHNMLLGYRLEREIAKGAFGTVYEATGPGGERMAVKVLLQEVRNNPDLLQSFRRGVRSMRILSDNGIDGMVAYRDASEIPAFVVMDWIDGPNLQTAVEAKFLGDWFSILRVSKDLVTIIRKAHRLPQRVLHRDLRPSNVMLKDYYTQPENWEVVVLDFDLSWHRGATERSVVHGSALLGYLAPEQIQRVRGVSTRHAAVDSFGLGMTLFFLVSGRHPIPTEHRHSSWAESVYQACGAISTKSWNSVRKRFGRLIINTTRDLQVERWDLAHRNRVRKTRKSRDRARPS